LAVAVVALGNFGTELRIDAGRGLGLFPSGRGFLCGHYLISLLPSSDVTPAIRIRNLSKRYRIRHEHRLPYRTLRDELASVAGVPLRWLQGQRNCSSEEFWALNDVSFEVQPGEVVGVIGRNGAGKSTLLKILSGITKPTSGRAELRGRVGSLLEVGAGFHPELAGRENIFLSGAVLGMKRAEIVCKFDEIVAFAEVERFLDTPVKRYSSGMYVRLAFSVAAHLERDILIIDEALAVGDAAFQKKCLGKMQDVATSGRTVLLVSHNASTIKALCQRVVWLEQGKVLEFGPADRIVDGYLWDSAATSASSIDFDETDHFAVQFRSVLTSQVPGSDDVVVHFRYQVHRPCPGIWLCVDVRNSDGVCVYYANDSGRWNATTRSTGLHDARLRLPLSLLAPGRYAVRFGFWQPGRDVEHFPTTPVICQRLPRPNELAAHGIAWPSVLCIPSEWS
jgi:lipopolysaccharide transport system ATP-binding protein